MNSSYDQIQDILINSANKEEDLFALFSRWGKDYLYSHVICLDFGLDNFLIKKILKDVNKKEAKDIQKQKFPEELEKWVSNIPTKRLLVMFNKKRNDKDNIFFCMKKELATREHVNNKQESKEIRRKQNKQKTSKLELKKIKINKKIIKLKLRGFNVDDIANILKIDKTLVQSLFPNVISEIKPTSQKQTIIVDYDKMGNPVEESFFLDILEEVSVSIK